MTKGSTDKVFSIRFVVNTTNMSLFLLPKAKVIFPVSFSLYLLSILSFSDIIVQPRQLLGNLFSLLNGKTSPFGRGFTERGYKDECLVVIARS